GEPLEFSAKVKWLACKEACIPGKAQLSLSLPVTAAGGKPQPDNTSKVLSVGYEGPLPSASEPSAASQRTTDILGQEFKIAGYSQQPLGLPAYLLMAFVGGFILNFMPCVLPVISIKVLSFVEQASEDPKRVFQLGLAFAGGIVGSFLLLGCVVVALQQAG